MSICSKKITGDIESSCTNPLYTGVMETAYIMALEDIESYTINGNIVSSITMVSGGDPVVTQKAYHCQVLAKTPFDGTSTEMVENAVMNGFTKTVHMVIPNDGYGFRANVIDNLANGTFVMVIEHKWNDSDAKSKFEVIGLQKGLKASALANDPNSSDTRGGWDITLVEEDVPMSGVYFYATSVTASRAALEALC